MAAVTIRNLSDETYRALKLRAAHNGRSAEAEIRTILEGAVRPPARLRVGSALSDIGRKANITNADADTLRKTHPKRPAKPMRLK